ncbi:hypothetical protein GALL_516860 [mine drainage metagenome]|uniref:Uncharacterized protein n=1 Tax=mine drainage metagenome TaxID=410659 RepID=A0A1J5PT48_9ZZZZ
MFGAGISSGIHGHGIDTQTTGSGGHPAGDFTPVGNQYFFKHGYSRNFSMRFVKQGTQACLLRAN